MTRLARVADGDGETFEVQNKLHAVRQRLELPRTPELYPVMRGRRPAHVVVRLPLGAGRDPDVLQKALKVVRRRVDDSGLRRLLRPDGRLHQYQAPSVRRRNKRRAAAARVRKAAQRVARRDE
jgi:hypothetical protein